MTIIFISSCVTLGYVYYLVTGEIDRLANATGVYLPIILGGVSTFFLFWSLSGLILKIVMGMKSIYYRKLNSFTLRQFSSKINTMSFFNDHYLFDVIYYDLRVIECNVDEEFSY